MAVAPIASPLMEPAGTVGQPMPKLRDTENLEGIGPGVDLMLAGLGVDNLAQGPSGTARITASVLNVGDVDAGASQVSFFLASDGQVTDTDLLLFSCQIAALPAGGLIDIHAEVNLSNFGAIDQNFEIYAKVDSADVIAEVNEINNISPVQSFSFEADDHLGMAANIETYVLLVSENWDVETTSDLAARLQGQPMGEALTSDDLAALRNDLAASGIDGFNPFPLFQFQIVQNLEGGAVGAVALYRDSDILNALPAGLVAFEVPAVGGALRPYDPGINLVLGTAAADSLMATSASDLMVGEAGLDVGLFAGDQSNYTLTLTSSSITLRDRGDPTGQIDMLISIERLDFGSEIEVFGDAPMQLESFSGPAKLSSDEFALITELYIAYFNRAPDAIGLYFWGSLFENGFTLEEMAASFFDQVETRATYADVIDADGGLIDADAFISEVYQNVLGRSPDSSGFAFWAYQLENNPDITTPTFILSIINGAKFAAEPVPQTFVDQAYLATKTEIGAYFSIIKGMSNVSNAREVMASYDGTLVGVSAAVELTDAFFEVASDPQNGEFLFPLVGVIDDPFSII